MKDLLIKTLKTLKTLNYPIFQQGSLNENEVYPESFFTFWNNNADGDGFYDNCEHKILWDFDLNFYSMDPALVNVKLLEAKERLRQAGFTVYGSGYDVLSDEVTHTGRGINVKFIEILGGKEDEV